MSTRTLAQEPLTLLRNPRAKRVRLKVVPPGRIEVVMPRGFDQRQLPALLSRHEAWLQSHLARVREESARAAIPPSEVAFAASGERWRLELQAGHEGRAGCREAGAERLLLRVGDASAWRGPLQRWLTRKARERLLPWLDEVSAETGLRYGHASIRAQRSRWGSCSARGGISLNRALLFLPAGQVRYLLLHELCHTVELNHSPRYWALVAEHMPDYRVHDQALRRAMDKIPLWARPGG